MIWRIGNRLLPFAGTLLLFAAAACQAPRDIPIDGTCGNTVVEPNAGEDCDTFALEPGTACGRPGSANQCRYICAPATDAPCPMGWACGTDGVCRASAGKFNDPDIYGFDDAAAQLHFADIDGDEHIDTIRLTQNEVTVRYWHAKGPLGDEADVLFEAAVYAVAVANIGSDIGRQLMVAVDSGIVFLRYYGDNGLTVLPGIQPAQSMTGPIAHHIVAVRARPPFTAHDIIGFDDDAAGVRMVVPFQNGAQSQMLAPETIDHAALSALGSHIPVANVDGTPEDEMLLAFKDAPAVVIYAATCSSPSAGSDACTLALKARIPLGAASTGQALFADVNGDGLVDVVAQVAVDGYVSRAVVALNTGSGFDDAHVEPRFDVLRADALCKTSRSNPVAFGPAGDFNGDGHVDFVVGGRVMFSTAPNNTLSTTDFQPGPCVSDDAVVTTEIVAADFNRDGVDDIAAATDGAGLGLLMGSKNGVFNRTRTSPPIAPRELSLGDFDGDGFIDLAFVTENAEIEVAFGGPQGPPETPTFIAVYDEEVTRLVPADLANAKGEPILGRDAGEPDRITDLLAISAQKASPASFDRSIWSGTTHRTMLPMTAVALVSSRNGLRERPVTIAAGRFGPSDDQRPDLLILAAETSTSGRGSRLSWWVAEGIGDYRFTAPVDLGSDCTEAFQEGCVDVQVADVDGDGRDEAIIMRSGSDPVPLLIHLYEKGGPAIRCESLPALPASSVGFVGSIALADFQGMGVARDLFVQYSTVDDKLQMRRSLFYPAKVGGFDAPLLVESGGDAIMGSAVTPIRFALDEPQRFASASEDAIEIYQRSADGFTKTKSKLPISVPVSFGPPLQLDRFCAGRALFSVDLSGDRLDDLVIASSDKFVVFRQKPVNK